MGDNNIKLNERVSVTGNQYVEILQAEIAKLREELKAAEKDRDEWKAEAVARSENHALLLSAWKERAETAEAAEAKLKALESGPKFTEVPIGRCERCGYAAPIPPADVQELQSKLNVVAEICTTAGCDDWLDLKRKLAEHAVQAQRIAELESECTGWGRTVERMVSREEYAELERKAAEQQAITEKCVDFMKDTSEALAAAYNHYQRIAELERKVAEHVNCHRCNGNGETHSKECPSYSEEFNQSNMAAYMERVAQAEERGMNEAVPEGWQVVPKEPTEEMARAFWNRYAEKAATCGGMWAAMLAAAPKPEVKP